MKIVLWWSFNSFSSWQRYHSISAFCGISWNVYPELKVVLDKSFGKGDSQHFACLTAHGAFHTCSVMAYAKECNHCCYHSLQRIPRWEASLILNTALNFHEKKKKKKKKVNFSIEAATTIHRPIWMVLGSSFMQWNFSSNSIIIKKKWKNPESDPYL